MEEPEATPIYVHAASGTWTVTFEGSDESFPDQTSARRHAISLARTHAPSVIVAGPPGTIVPTDDDAGITPPPVDEPTVVVVVENRTAPAVPTSSTRRVARPAELAAGRGPHLLGRSVIVAGSQDVPDAWASCQEVVVSPTTLGTDTLLAEVRHAYLTRTATVFRLADGVDAPNPAIDTEAVWSLGPDHDLFAEDTWDLLVANAIDVRGGSPVWPLLDAAVRLGAEHLGDEDADVALPDGRRVLIDGGPLDLRLGSDLPILPAVSIAAGWLRTVSDAPLTDQLDPSQVAAVAEPIMRSRIIAPAGSGKTRVLTERSRHLVASGIPAGSILMVAFNKRAQEEMEERTRDLGGLRILTLNALAFAIVSGTRGFARRGGSLSTLDEMGVRDLLGSMVSFPRRANADPAASWIEALSSIRLGLRDPRTVEAEYNGDVAGLAELFPRWREALADRRQVDFDEQVYLAIEVLLREPEVRDVARGSIGVLLVDEYQDLNPAHMLLLRLLAGPDLPIFGVGDDDQTIYGYSGATPEWLVDFDRFIPESTHHALSTNYRCPATVVTAASNLLTRNRVRVPKVIEAGPGASSDPGTMVVVEAAEPVAETTRRVLAALDAGARPEDVCVLTRVNALLAPVEVALREQGVAVTNRDGGNLLSRTGARAALAWFALATSGSLDEAAVHDAARRPSRGLSPRVIDWMSEQSDVAGIRRLAGRINDDKAAEKVAAFAADLERLTATAKGASADRILEAIRRDLGLDQSLAALDSSKQGRNAAAHSDDLRALVALGQLHPDASTFLDWVRRALSQRNDHDGVTLSTVHKVKGLEWPHVVVHDASGGVIPHRLSTDVEEERRVFHVAITRAKATLAVVADADDPSLFLHELSEPGAPSPATTATRRSGAGEAGARPTRDGVAAAEDLRFVWGSYDCVVTAVGESGVTVSIGTSSTTIPFGSAIAVDGRSTQLDPAAPAGRPSRARADTSGGPVDEGIFAALKAWRLERSRTDGVPAYVVADNKTLEAISAAMPTDEHSLLAVAGIGPAKLELYGDEILAVLDQLRG